MLHFHSEERVSKKVLIVYEWVGEVQNPPNKCLPHPEHRMTPGCCSLVVRVAARLLQHEEQLSSEAGRTEQRPAAAHSPPLPATT